MSSVDNRIVKMIFDNEKFESGVQKTLDTLDKLKEKLTFKNSEKVFDGIEASINGMNFNGVESGVEALQKRFSTLGIVGMEVTRRITNAAIDAGKKIANATVGQVKQGGMTRALNIEQARFQLKGLGLDVEEITQNALDAVKGTAYGLDEAAKAASVLGASGVKAGKDMKNTLTSIAGAAAMTGRGFGDIADIYSTVASNGKLMTEQLRQFSHSGLNVTAVLQEAYGKTGAEIQEMVKDGEISFKEFSNAMQKFGKHAQSANETYTGSLANMKAALSRLGAIFATTFDDETALGYIENMKYLFNAITPLIDQVTSALGPFAKQVRTVMTSFRKSFVQVIETLTGDKDKVTGPIVDLVHGLVNIINALGSVIKPIGKAFRDVFSNATMSNFVSAIGRFKEFTATLKLNARQAKNMEYFYKAIFSIFKLIGTVVKTVIDGIARVFKPLGGLLNVVNFIVGIVSRLVYWFVTAVTKVRLVSRAFTAITYVISGVFYAIRYLVEGIVWVVQAIAHSKPVVAVVNAISSAFKFCVKYISLFIDKLREVAKKVASFIGNAALKVITKFVDVLSRGLQAGAKYAAKLIDKIKELFGRIKESKPFIAFSNTIDTIRKNLSKAAEKVKTFTKAIADWVSEHHLVQTFVNALSTGIQIIIYAIGLAAGKIKDFAVTVYNFFKETGIIDGFVKVFHKGFEKARDIIKEVAKHLSKFIEYLSTTFRSKMEQTGDKAKETGEKVRDGIKNGFEFAFVKNGIKVFSDALDVLKRIGGPIVSLISAIVSVVSGGLEGLVKKFPEAFEKIKDAFKNADWQKIADYFPYEAFGVFLLSLSSFVRRLGKVNRSFRKTIDHIGGLFKALKEKITGNLTGTRKWKERAKNLIIFAGAVYIFAKAIQLLGNMDPKKLAIGGAAAAGSLAALVVAMVVLAKVLDKNDKELSPVNMAQVGVGMVLMATSLLILSKAIKTFAKMKWTTFGKGLLFVAFGLAALSGAVWIMSKGGSLEGILGASAGITLMTLALYSLAVVIKIFSKFRWTTFGKGLLFVAFGLAALSGAVWIMSKGGGLKGILAAAVGIDMMVVALYALAGIIKIFGSMNTDTLLVGLGVVAGLLLSLTVSLKVLQKVDAKGVGVGMLMIASALGIIAIAVKLLNSVKIGTIIASLGGFVAILITMGVAFSKLDKSTDLLRTAASILVVSAALGVIALAVKQLEDMKLGALIASFVGLVVIFGAIIAALVLLGKPNVGMNLLPVAAAIGIMAVSLGLLSVAMAELAKQDFGGIAAAFGALVLVMAAFTLVGALVVATGGWLAAGLLIVAAAMLIVAIATEKFGDGVEAAANGMKTFADEGERGSKRAVDAINAFIEGLADSAGRIAAAAVKIVHEFSNGLVSMKEELGEAGYQMLLGVLHAADRHVEEIWQTASSIVIKFCRFVGNNTEPLLKAGIAMVYGILAGISEAIRTSGELAGLLGRDMASAFVEGLLSMMQNAFAGIPGIGEEMTKALEQAKQKVHEWGGHEELKKKIDEKYDEALEAIGVGNNSVGEKVDGLKNTFKGKLLEMLENAGITGENIPESLSNGILSKLGLVEDASGQVNEATLSAVPEDYQELFSKYGMEMPEGLSLGMLSGKGDVTSAWGQILGGLDSQSSAEAKKAPDDGKAYGDGYTSGIEKAKKPNLSTLLASIKSVFSSSSKDYSSEGEKVGASYAKGVSSQANKKKAADAGRAVSDSAKKAAGSVDFSTAGNACLSGFLNGLKSKYWINQISAQGTAIGNAAYEAAKKAVKVSSPSKKFKELGVYSNMGFVLGLKSMRNKVYDAGYTVGETATDALTESVSKVYDLLNADLDTSPTITPVLDLSNVQNGIDSMNGMLDTRTMSASISGNMRGIGLQPAFAAATGDNVTNNNTNTFNITVDGAESPEAFADRLVEAIHMRQRMS